MITPRIELLADAGAYLIPFGLRKQEQLEALRQSLGTAGIRKVYPVDGFTVTVETGEFASLVRIEGSLQAGFLYRKKSVPTDYTLADEDKDSGNVYLDGEWTLGENSPYNYGNIDWIGADDVLTWKGPPSRYFALDPLVNYPGLTVEEETISGGDTYYTPFTANIYQDGAILATAPGLVLGAALQGGVLLAIVCANYRGVANPAGGTGGYYYEVHGKYAKWERLGFALGRRASVPFFFNQSGTVAQTVHADRTRVKLTVDAVAKTASFSYPANGKRTITSAITKGETTDTNAHPLGDPNVPPTNVVFVKPPYGNGWAALGTQMWYYDDWDGIDNTTTTSTTVTVDQKGSQVIAVDYKGDMEVTATVTLQGCTEKSVISNIGKSSYNQVDRCSAYAATGPQVSPMTISGPGTATVGAKYTADNCLSTTVSWGFSKGTINSQGVITSIVCTPGDMATAIVSATQNGMPASDDPGYSVYAQLNVLVAGHWVFDSDVFVVFSQYCNTCASNMSGGSGIWSDVLDDEGDHLLQYRIVAHRVTNTCPDCNTPVPTGLPGSGPDLWAFSVKLYYWRC